MCPSVYETNTYDSFSKWIKKIYEIHGKEINTGNGIYQDISSLYDLRSALIHYNPRFIEHVNWPIKIQKIVDRAKPEIINSGWETNLSTTKVLDWAYETSKAIIKDFNEQVQIK